MTIDYNIYPSILDSYTRYKSSDQIYDKIWGFSEVPSKTREEFLEEQLQDFLGALNRVPFESVYADLGTAYNDVVDEAIIGERRGESAIVKIENNAITAALRGRDYVFPIDMVDFLKDRFDTSTPQVFVSGDLETNNGNVRLYGYLDELMPFSVHDIKVTHRYEPWKFKGNAQHLVYPYCLVQMDLCDPYLFQYDIMEVRSNAKDLEKSQAPKSEPCIVTSWEYHQEQYGFYYDLAKEELKKRCEDFIGWIEEHADLINNPKLFGQDS